MIAACLTPPTSQYLVELDIFKLDSKVEGGGAISFFQYTGCACACYRGKSGDVSKCDVDSWFIEIGNARRRMHENLRQDATLNVKIRIQREYRWWNMASRIEV